MESGAEKDEGVATAAAVPTPAVVSVLGQIPLHDSPITTINEVIVAAAAAATAAGVAVRSQHNLNFHRAYLFFVILVLLLCASFTITPMVFTLTVTVAAWTSVALVSKAPDHFDLGVHHST
jgi:hypothetical protein